MRALFPIFLILLIPMSKTSLGQELATPELGDPYASILSLDEEKIIGFSAYKGMQRYNYIVNDPLASSYIKYLGNLITRQTLDERRNYNFFLVKSATINAFALPGGYVGLNTGLVALTKNEAQLVGVMAHEVAHVKLRHSAEMLANSARTSLPAFIGIVIGILSGNPQGGLAAMQSGLGISAQMSINLIRSNEIEADEFAISLLRKTNFDVSEMANFFELMQSSTSTLNPQLAYFYTHPLYENRIARIRSRANKTSSFKTITNDYGYVKNILEVFMSRNVDVDIKSIKQKDSYGLHKLALLYKRKSQFKTAISFIKGPYEKNPENIYISVLYAQLLERNKQHQESIKVLQNLMDIYPFNSSIPFYLGETLIENNLRLNDALEMLKKVEGSYKYNPNYFRLMSKAFVRQGDVFNSKIYLSDYYVLIDNLNLAVQVLDDGIQSRGLRGDQIDSLKKKKQEIICKYQRPLEPLFGEKTC
ncbi:MAG: M48 family metalloprotease [Pseudomonadota bacterium]|nr:M48 family metalloprotease [Pseudomonadota bacterium]